MLENVTRHKILRHAEYHKAKRRSPKAELRVDQDQLIACTPTAEEQAVVADLIEKILENLDQDYGKIVLLLLEGHSERSIAEQLGCAGRAVSTKLDRLRRRLAKLLEEDSNQERS